MSKKPLLEENVARRWAKYAGIETHSKKFLAEAYSAPPLEEKSGVVEEDDTLEEDGILAELEGLLEQDVDVDADMEMDAGDEDIEADIDVDDMGDEGEGEGEEEIEAEVSMSQEDVETALKTGLEAMASAIGDALKIKIDVRSGGEEEEGEEEIDAEEEIMEMDDDGESEGDEGAGAHDHETDYEDEGDRKGDEGAGDEKDSEDYEDEEREGDKSKTHSGEDYVHAESLNRDALVEKVMKRVAARLVKESKKKRRR